MRYSTNIVFSNFTSLKTDECTVEDIAIDYYVSMMESEEDISSLG